MTRDAHSAQAHPQVQSMSLGGRARAIVLRGAVRGQVAEELRGELLAAVESGVRELVLDLSGVESISSPTRDLVAAVGSTLARRGGVLLIWWQKDGPAEPGYVMAELRDHGLASILPNGPPRSRP
jgi:hypothetical protein